MDYKTLVHSYSLLEQTSSRLEMTHILAKLLKSTPAGHLSMICLLVQGKLFPGSSEENLGVSDKSMIKVLKNTYGHSQEAVEKLWKEKGDLGDVAAQLARKKTQQTLASADLTVSKVFKSLRKLPDIEGEGSVAQKIKIVADLLADASPKEARYIVRTVLGALRLGVGDGTVRDAIVWAFFGFDEKYVKGDFHLSVEEREEFKDHQDRVQRAYDVCNDFGQVAKAAKKGSKALEKMEVDVGTPLKLMLCQRAKDIEDAFERVGSPACFEYKYDGFRMQVHKQGDEIKLFTRRLEEVTKQFPDIVKAIKQHVKGDGLILDAECVGYDPKSKKYLPFQKVSQRIKRKHNIEQMAKDYPVELVIFDVLMDHGKSCLDVEQQERRKRLEKLVHEKKYVVTISNSMVTDDRRKAKKFFGDARAEGHEGLIAKSLDSLYQPGSRVGFQVKVKGALDTLDLVILAAEWGEGKRSGWLTSFTLGARAGDGFKEVGKVGTGLKEKESSEGVTFEEITEKLKPLIKKEHGKHVDVKPRVVVEVQAEEIQESPTYSGGFALRFPRVLQVREDKGPDEATSLQEIKRIYAKQ